MPANGNAEQKGALRVERSESGGLVVHAPGRDEPVPDAHVARCFPWSLPNGYISIRDGNGKEVAMLKSTDELEPDSRAVVEQELKTRVFSPKIQQVLKVRKEFDVTTITARTDRGNVDFQLRMRDDVRVLSPTRALFRDVDGNIYELADLAAMDSASRKLMEQYF